MVQSRSKSKRKPLRPQNCSSSLIGRGIELSEARRWDECIKALEAGLAVEPDHLIGQVNLARAYLHVSRLDDALRVIAAVRQRHPDLELGALIQAEACNRLQRFVEAEACLQSLPLASRTTKAFWFALGYAQQLQGKHAEAIASFMKALHIKMDDAQSHYSMGLSFFEMSLKDEACECFRTALLMGLGAQTIRAVGALAFVERETCQWDQSEPHLQQLRELVAALTPDSAVDASLFTHATLMDDPMHQLMVARAMTNRWRDFGQRDIKRAARRAGGRLRIGYLSGDFHAHATCVLMAEVFEQHDRARFEVFAYSHGPDERSAMRTRVEDAIEHFVDVRALPSRGIAQRIADDQIDILIDLKGHTAGNRLEVLAYRPAPIQVTFLGFPGTTGASFIDYIIGDEVVTPLAHASHYSEHIAQMPVCYQPNDRQRPLPRPMRRADAGLPEDALVLCGFNQPYKISPAVMDVWCGLLHDLPEAVLWLLDWHNQARPNLEREFQMRGIDFSRVHWAPRMDLADHISRLSLADIFIDTWPCNAHTTASDALWAGVPLVTFLGPTFASRVASSLLHAVGLDELICDGVEGYRSTIKSLAGDPVRRAGLRAALTQARDTAPLFDSEGFTRDYEALLARMVDRQRARLPTESLPGLVE
jgi:predicted O-linked N-acetylglucosamine transferase (SPINDLY family)